jgi:hypothetical protein
MTSDIKLGGARTGEVDTATRRNAQGQKMWRLMDRLALLRAGWWGAVAWVADAVGEYAIVRMERALCAAGTWRRRTPP